MTAIEKAVKAWYLLNIPKPYELDQKVEATLEYVKRFNEPEDGEWAVFAYEIIDGHHGQYTVRMFLEEVENLEGVWMDNEDLDAVMEAFDTYSRELAKEFNRNTNLPGKFYIGHNEADGSLGAFYTVRA